VTQKKNDVKWGPEQQQAFFPREELVLLHCHAPASEKIEQYNGRLKTPLKAMERGGTFKHWDTHPAKATWLVNTRGSTNGAGPAQSKLPRTAEGDKVPAAHMKNMLGKTVWGIPAMGKGKPIHGITFAQGHGCTWWVMWKDGEGRWVPQGDLILGKCRGLAWLDLRYPPKLLYHSTSSTGQGRKKYDERLLGQDEHREKSLSNYCHMQNRLNLEKVV